MVRFRRRAVKLRKLGKKTSCKHTKMNKRNEEIERKMLMKCSTSFPGGNLVDGLPPALNLAERFGLKVLSATLRLPLICRKYPRELGEFVMRNARASKLPKMGGDLHGHFKNGTWCLVQCRSGAKVDTG